MCLGIILADVSIMCFADIHIQSTKDIGNAEKTLIPNVFILCNLLIVNSAIPWTPEQFFNYKTHKNLAGINND